MWVLYSGQGNVLTDVEFQSMSMKPKFLSMTGLKILNSLCRMLLLKLNRKNRLENGFMQSRSLSFLSFFSIFFVFFFYETSLAGFQTWNMRLSRAFSRSATDEVGSVIVRSTTDSFRLKLHPGIIYHV